mgnify:CR=1 FL=1
MIHRFKEGKLHVYIRQDTYKGKLRSENWVGRASIGGKQKIISSGTTDLEKAKEILEKWYDEQVELANNPSQKDEDNLDQNNEENILEVENNINNSTSSTESSNSQPLENTNVQANVNENTNNYTENQNAKPIETVQANESAPSSIANKIQSLYNSIITAGTYLAPSIKVAEASKIIENVQRDVNISLVNEFALIFEKLEIDTTDVLNAASTKWNFLNFKPGLVGGHCIGVDPYYLAHKAILSGYKPKVLINGRKVNNSISKNIVLAIEKKAKSKKIDMHSSRVLILGITFKENCSDTRNSRVVDLYKDLAKVSKKVDIHDYYADKIAVKKEFGIELIQNLNNKYDVIVLAVAHNKYLKLDYSKLLKKNHILYDVKSVLPKNIITLRL